MERMDLEESRNRLNQSVAYYSFESPPNVAKVRQFPSILCLIPCPNVAKDLLLRRSTNAKNHHRGSRATNPRMVGYLVGHFIISAIHPEGRWCFAK